MNYLIPGATRHLNLWGDEGNYPDYYPVVISWNQDLGWIIETVECGEYEVQNLPYYEGEINSEIDWKLACEEAEKRGVRIRYYHKWNPNSDTH